MLSDLGMVIGDRQACLSISETVNFLGFSHTTVYKKGVGKKHPENGIGKKSFTDEEKSEEKGLVSVESN